MDGLHWIDEDTERGRIEAVRAQLGSKLTGLPDDLCDDLQICRFLRGHSNDPKIAAEFMDKALAFRSALIEKDDIKQIRSKLAGALKFDLSLLPHAEQILEMVPLRDVEGSSTEGLPITLTASRLVDIERFNKLGEEGDRHLSEFFQGMTEMRALVLHNLSHAQHRMVKILDIRDMTQASITKLLTEGRGLIVKLKEQISKVQNYYPEIVHQSCMFNTPSTFAKLFAVVSTVLNERMKAKVRLHPLGTRFQEFASVLQARAVYSWLHQATAGVDFSSGATVANSSVEYQVRWLEKGDSCRLSVSVEDLDIKVHCIFLPQDAASRNGYQGANEAIFRDAATISSEEVTVLPKEPYETNFVADCSGVLILCFDNYSSWWNAKTVTLSMS